MTVVVTVEDGQLLNRYRLVDDPAWKLTVDGIVLPPMSAAVIV